MADPIASKAYQSCSLILKINLASLEKLVCFQWTLRDRTDECLSAKYNGRSFHILPTARYNEPAYGDRGGSYLWGSNRYSAVGRFAVVHWAWFFSTSPVRTSRGRALWRT